MRCWYNLEILASLHILPPSTSFVLTLYSCCMSFPIKSAIFDATIAWKFPSISRWSNSSSAFSFNSSLPLPLLLLASSSSLHLHYKRAEVDVLSYILLFEILHALQFILLYQ